MLALELRGEPYNKAAHNRRLIAVLNGRSRQAVEFKHANISAVLIELGFPYIAGYKPRGNYQELLKEEVARRLDGDAALREAAANLVTAPATAVEPGVLLDGVLVDPPVVPLPGVVREPSVARHPRLRVNYLEQEARNASLGAAGEALVLAVEHRRLWTAGRRDLAERIVHVSRELGDGAGYDILSFDATGRERLIEVKTTAFGPLTPFFATRNEVAVSEERAEAYRLYRVFRFRENPKAFVLEGSLRRSVTLEPVHYQASLR